MRNIWRLIAAIIQLAVGIVAITSYIIVINNAQIIHLLRWRITLILAIGFVIIGSVGIIDWIVTERNIIVTESLLYLMISRITFGTSKQLGRSIQ